MIKVKKNFTKNIHLGEIFPLSKKFTYSIISLFETSKDMQQYDKDYQLTIIIQVVCLLERTIIQSIGKKEYKKAKKRIEKNIIKR